METSTNAADAQDAGRDSPPEESADQPWLDVGDLARRYKTSVRHIYRMADSGRMPWGVKFGALRRWARREIEAWEKAGCRPVRAATQRKR